MPERTFGDFLKEIGINLDERGSGPGPDAYIKRPDEYILVTFTFRTVTGEDLTFDPVPMNFYVSDSPDEKLGEAMFRMSNLANKYSFIHCFYANGRPVAINTDHMLTISATMGETITKEEATARSTGTWSQFMAKQ